MEKKTLGSFLSILRKAKGMTQRELAELLNVSDKAVSRWERDESMPDILLLPVLADIFDVSCDDLLRGERKGTDAYQETSEKRIQRTTILIKKSKSKFQAFSMVSIGVALVGFIIAVVLNFSFNKATIGFYCALIGILAGGMAQAAFYIYFNSDIDTDILTGREFVDYKKYIRDHTLHILCFLGTLLLICLPLLFLGQVSYADYIAALNAQMAPEGFEPQSTSTNTVFPMGKIAVGLPLKTWLLYGGISGAAGALISFVINFATKLQDAKKERFGVTELDVQKSKRNILQFLKYLLILIILVGVTFAGSKLFEAKMPEVLQTGRQFDNFDDFKVYMEKVPYDMYPGVVELRQQLDKYKGTVYGDNGELLCEYIMFNDSVVGIEFGENNKLPITVYSEDDQTIAKQKTEDLMWIWRVAIVVECFGVAAVDFISKMKANYYKGEKT